ncbi:DUF1697 domain-containing protein [Ponticaulis sp.]|uniref:DUF1697 domain-containing protein n=1 Tax=Ponticaulis sp. TaxID=2020902 RepID=UPI00262DC6F7|nr:DUF1697 domain-containing protein [Ponticaulis sp.]MDF1680285.1 DUF1697 domain-containing protein [Ponticaulis sp.]
MATHIAFLRAVNVGGTGKLPMETLRCMCAEAGFENPRTYIASGNLVFESEKASEDACAILEQKLENYAGKPVGVIVRSPADVKAICENNPFPDAPGNKVIALLLPDTATPADTANVKHQQDEQIIASNREIYVHYASGQGKSRLKLEAQDRGTARNMNTLSKVYSLATTP